MRTRLWIGGALAVAMVSLSVACGGDGDKKEISDATTTSADATATLDPALATPTQFVQAGRTPVLKANIQDKPCEMLSDDEMKAATGGGVQSKDAVADKAQPACRWIVDPEAQGEVKVLQIRASVFAEPSVYEAAGRNGKVDIGGLADGAYALPMGTDKVTPGFVLWVKSGDKTFSILITPVDPLAETNASVRLAFNDRALVVATAMAKTIATRL